MISIAELRTNLIEKIFIKLELIENYSEDEVKTFIEKYGERNLRHYEDIMMNAKNSK